MWCYKQKKTSTNNDRNSQNCHCQSLAAKSRESLDFWKNCILRDIRRKIRYNKIRAVGIRRVVHKRKQIILPVHADRWSFVWSKRTQIITWMKKSHVMHIWLPWVTWYAETLAKDTRRLIECVGRRVRMGWALGWLFCVYWWIDMVLSEIMSTTEI